jgi:stress-induced morphogen
MTTVPGGVTAPPPSMNPVESAQSATMSATSRRLLMSCSPNSPLLTGHFYYSGAEKSNAGATMAAMATEPLQALLQQAFPDATELSVLDRTGGGDHFQVTVASPRFEGLSLVDQHKLVYDALAAPLADGSIHELRIKTKGQP